MTTNVNYTSAATDTIGRANRQDALINPDFAIICLWAFVGLSLTALAAVVGYGPEIAAALSLAGF